jgi:DNA-binding CsgD family transcriptional regulator
MRQGESQRSSRVGLLLLNSQLRPVHYNAEAANILGFPKKAGQVPSMDAVFPASLFHLDDLSKPAPASGIAFISGRRRYLCRVFLLDPTDSGANRHQPRVVIVLERGLKQPVDITRLSQEFQLTTRERETVEFLLKGMTSKEIAHQMHISPNTVKSFLKLVMAKVGVTTRIGLIARIFERAS